MSQRPREAGDGRLLLPNEVEFDPERASYLLRFGDQLADPFDWTADRLLLAESFVRLDLADRGACQRWFTRHGAVDRWSLHGLVLGAGGVRATGRHEWDSQDEEGLVADEQEGVGWLLTTLAHLSDQRSSRAWDPAWGQVVLVGAAEGLIVGGPHTGARVWPSLAWESWIETHRAEPASGDEVEKQSQLIAATEGWPRVSVIEYRWGNVQLAVNDRKELSLIDEIEGSVAVLGTTWDSTLDLVQLIIEPYLQRAVERLFTTEFLAHEADGGARRTLVPRAEHVWRSILSPIYLQLFESLRRITEDQPGAAICRECGRPFLVLDARRRFFCNERERFRHAQRERRRRLRAEEERE